MAGLILVLSLAGCSTGGAASTTTLGMPSTHTTTSIETSSHQPPSPPANPIDFKGKYALESLSFPTTEDGFAVIGGFLDGTVSVGPWLSRTTNGGQTWRVIGSVPRVGSLVFNSARDGWSWGPRLMLTTNGGTSWRAVPTAAPVAALRTSGSVTWIIESRLRSRSVHPLRDTCRSMLLVSTGLGRAPTPVAHQPQLGDVCGPQLVVTSPRSVYILGVDGSASSYLGTDNGGYTWRKADTPCSRLRFGDISFLGGEGRSLLLECAYGQALDTFGDHLGRAYQSNDGGSSWHVIGTEGGENGENVTTASGGIAWSFGEAPTGMAYLERSIDGGRNWKTLVPWSDSSERLGSAILVQPPLSGVQFVMAEALVASGDMAALAIETYPSASSGFEHFLIGVTDNIGLSWHWAYVPDVAGKQDG